MSSLVIRIYIKAGMKMKIVIQVAKEMRTFVVMMINLAVAEVVIQATVMTINLALVEVVNLAAVAVRTI